MKTLSDDASELVCGGATFSLSIPIALNNIVAPQINVAAPVAVVPFFGGALASVDQANGLIAGQLAAALGS